MRTLFVEREDFARKLYSITTDDDYQVLQRELEEHPLKGDLIPGLGGARKIRMGIGHGGKRGGARVVYYFKIEAVIWLLDIYSKAMKKDLSPSDKKRIAHEVAQIKAGK